MLKNRLLFAGALALLLTSLPFFSGQDESIRVLRLEARMKRLEAMMEALLQRMDIDPATIEPAAPAENPAIREALLSGNKILAIKVYREQYTVGLREAKEAIDAMEGNLRG